MFLSSAAKPVALYIMQNKTAVIRQLVRLQSQQILQIQRFRLLCNTVFLLALSYQSFQI
jgi:TRAP-type mannitol/chloroaromatic compound transport system permease small subunit